MATFQGGAGSDAAPLVLEIIRLTNLPTREHDRTRCPFVRVHLEPADAPPPLPPRSPEVSPKDLAKLMAQKSLSEEDAARVKDALATGAQPAPEEQKKGRWSRTRAAAAALQKKASSTTSALRARAKEHLDETRAPPNAPGSTEPVETSQRPNTLEPQFFAFLRVAERCTQDDVVVVRVHDASVTRTKYLGEARVPVGFLSSSTTPFVVALAAEKHRSNDACEVHVRRVPVSKGPPRTVSLILVRHGESRWNEAKSDQNYSAMVSKRDHPLTPVGVGQARGLNDKWRRALSRDFGERPLPFLELDESGYLGDRDDAERLERVDVVWASPLTRALQTALIGFHGFPPLRSLALHASCREVKNVGGFDSVGLATGSYNILQRCEKKLAEAVGQPEAAAHICNGLACDARDAAGEWWLPSERREGKKAVDRRAAEFLREVQYETLEGHCQAPLVVSHSHFIRGLFKRYRDAADVTTKPFSVKKLANCGVVAVDVVFDDATGGAPSMRNPRLLFGSALEGDGESDESSEDESGSRLERAKNFGSGVLSSIEKRVRPARSYANTPDTGSVDLLGLDGPLFAPVAPPPCPPRAAPSFEEEDGSLI